LLPPPFDRKIFLALAMTAGNGATGTSFRFFGNSDGTAAAIIKHAAIQKPYFRMNHLCAGEAAS
jgi:hypothetical protein